MGITVNDYFENIYSVIFSPKAFFEREDMQISVRLAFVTVVFISLINRTAISIADGSINNLKFYASTLFFTIGTLILWLITALFFEYIAKIFNQDGHLSQLLFLTSFAFVPYILFAPLNLLKQADGVFALIATVGELLIYLYIIWLYVLSLKSTYNISYARALMMIFIPFISTFFSVYWVVCFCHRLWYIFSI